jgi:hypothetical protein
MLESEDRVYVHRKKKLLMMVVDYSSLSTTNTTRHVYVCISKIKESISFLPIIYGRAPP